MSADVYQTDCVVIGAGAVGLACAAELARRGREVLVLEAASGIGSGISSRNSEVIHAGMYYPTGTLKHLMCVAGRRKLYPYLAARGVAHRKFGKLIVATDPAEESKIAAIHTLAADNGVEHCTLIGAADLKALEPHVRGVSAMFSPETGVVDSHGYMLALLGDVESHGGSLALNAPVMRGEALDGGGFEIEIGGEAPARIRCNTLVNSAGLNAQAIARSIAGIPESAIPPLVLAKGSYFGCSARTPFTHLIYPAPVDGGLGVHLTLDLGGRAKFGPDIEWLDQHDPARVDYAVDPARAESFYAAIRRYWPGLPDGALTPDYAGCRPKLSRRGEPAADFRIDGPET
ncbi:MAG TPA: NAD(P)/FAD-dependent oxidoreductase, partial [Vitreimonas sp.]|nr:NAD(P)/FAD-dependent oxidoreductase [Vitreimonas sp.]